MKYEIKGHPFPIVTVDLETDEAVRCQNGAMAWMTPNMEMSTTVGGAKKALGKMLSGENIFENVYAARGGAGSITFAPDVPGEILVMEVSPENVIIAQKSSFLVRQESVDMEIAFQRKLGTGVFGGEGFIMQKFVGNGLLFLQGGGTLINKNLAEGEVLLVQTGNLCAMESTVTMDIETVKGLGNMLVGGEGFFNTKLTGPGQVWIQTMPTSSLASAIRRYIPSR
jgi:uncharacterized protein (TIGR00266 family)